MPIGLFQAGSLARSFLNSAAVQKSLLPGGRSLKLRNILRLLWIFMARENTGVGIKRRCCAGEVRALSEIRTSSQRNEIHSVEIKKTLHQGDLTEECRLG